MRRDFFGLFRPCVCGRAKTGTLNDVSSLSGFMETRAKTMLAFTIMVNGTAAGNGNFFKMQQELLSELYENF
jgi:D-alanyl-D-alanine carboxypeptidase